MMTAALPLGADVLKGRVEDPAGQPVKEIKVALTHVGSDRAEEETDDMGAFEFDGVPVARYTLIVVDKKRNLIVRKEVDLATTHEVTLRLAEGPHGTIVGNVIGAGGNLPAIGLSKQLWSKVVYPDQSGHFRAEHVPVGLVEVNADFARRRLRPAWVTVSPDSEVKVNLNVPPVVKVQGTVRRGGSPVSDATVSFDGPELGSGATAVDGTYAIEMSPGEYEVRLFSNKPPHPLPLSKHVSIKAATTIDLNVESASVHVSVIDVDTKEPVEGVEILAFQGDGSAAFADVLTSKDGTADLDLTVGGRFRLETRKGGYARAIEEINAVDSNVTLRTRHKTGVIVRLTDARDGHTIGGYVVARDTHGRTLFFSPGPNEAGSVPLPLLPGEYQISGSADGYGSETVKVSIPASDLRIPLPRGGNLAIHATKACDASARLLQSNGEPYVRCWCNGIASIRIDCLDSFVDHISPGSYTLELTYEDGRKKQFPVNVMEGETVTVSID